MEEFDYLKIQLEDIRSATNDFEANKRIGVGGFGPVYKGVLSRPEGDITVACKRLDRIYGQGHVEFLKEILMLSICKHENLVTLLHFCIEGDERVLVYECASRGSLDGYLSDPSLTWTQRLKICVGVARALKYLHDPTDTHQSILHRDIKSSNILLDEEWNAKLSDFGLSKFGPTNEPQTYDVSNAVGTRGYCDPVYSETGILSKESDVYSFGVVLFEVMCGTLCYEYDEGMPLRVLVHEWKKCFEEKRLDAIISHDLQQQMEPGSLNTFSTIAYQCLNRARKERPTMTKIMQELEIALKQQELDEDMRKGTSFEELRRIADLAVSPLSDMTPSRLLLLFMEGVLVDNGKTWFSVNKKGKHCELLSVEKCTTPSYFTTDNSLISRFQKTLEYVTSRDLRLTVTTQFLSPHVIYVINLVYYCTIPDEHDLRIPFKYKLEEMREYSTSFVAHVDERGWLRTELFQFTSTKREHYFDIHFYSEIDGYEHGTKAFCIYIEGVEFCPVDFEEKEEYNMDMQPTDIEWGERVPDDYTKLVKWSKDIKEWMTGEEVYSLLRKGVYNNNSQQWFSISKKSKNRLMLPARAILTEPRWNFLLRGKSWLWKALPGSRFNEVAESCDKNHLAISLQIESQLLSPDIMYACYLVFKLPENASVFGGIVITCFKERFQMHKPTERQIYLLTPPHTPIIEVSPEKRASRTQEGWLDGNSSVGAFTWF